MTPGFICFTLIQIKEWNATIEFYKFWENRSNKVYKLSELFLFILSVFYFYSVCLNSFSYFFMFSNSDLVPTSSKALTKAFWRKIHLSMSICRPSLSLAPSSPIASCAHHCLQWSLGSAELLQPSLHQTNSFLSFGDDCGHSSCCFLWDFSVISFDACLSSFLPAFVQLFQTFPWKLPSEPAALLASSSCPAFLRVCPSFLISNLQIRPISSSLITLLWPLSLLAVSSGSFPLSGVDVLCCANSPSPALHCSLLLPGVCHGEKATWQVLSLIMAFAVRSFVPLSTFGTKCTAWTKVL